MPIIEVDHVTKTFQLGQLQSIKQTVQHALARLRGRPVLQQEPFKALHDVSFSVESGEVLGIIGTNGAGKSTILKLLAGITVPSTGRVRVQGSIAPLIEVGAGLIGDMTGRENIFLNGAILGMRRADIKKKFDEIVAFAELEAFIDTPVKRYSSGMSVRLGFSIATAVDPDILLVDEVLAVGDLAFQRKCFDRMEDLIKRRGKTVIIVGHNIRQLERMCSRVILLDHGKILKDGSPAEVCNLFYNLSNDKVHRQQEQQAQASGPSITQSGEVQVEDIRILDGAGEPSDNIPLHGAMRVGIRFRVREELASIEVVVGFHTSDFVYVATASTAPLPDHYDFAEGTHYIECLLDDMLLTPGVYNVRVGFFDKFRRMMWYGENLKSFKVITESVGITKMPENGLVALPFRWHLH